MGKKTIKGLDYPLKKSKKLDAALEAGSKTGSVAVMSPKQYLKHAKRLPDTKEDRLLIEAFKSRMQKGKKFKPLKLLGHNQADGRHRATAAEEIGIKEVPVIDYRESGLKKMKDVHSVSQRGSKVGKIEEELRKERASGGQVNAAHLPLEDHDPNAAFRKLIAWSFAVAPLFSHPRLNRADGGEVEGDVQFAPEEDTPSLPTFAQQNPQESIRAALEAAKSLPEKREATLSAYEPTIGEKIYGSVAGLGSERPSPERRRFAEGVSELAGFTPGLGNVMAAQEAKRAGEGGDYGGMALAALGAVPAFGPVEKKAMEIASDAVQAARESRAARKAGSSWEKMNKSQREEFMSYPDKELGKVSIHDADPEELLRQERAHEQGYSGPWYHGTQRLDRLLEGKSLNPKRATSGPMPFFTNDPKVASSYAIGKQDTSRMAGDEGVENYFTVHPKSIGLSNRKEMPVERSWHFLPQETKEKILENYGRIGYADRDEAMGDFVVHPEFGGLSSPSHYDYILKNEAKGNPLTALRNIWYEGGDLINNPEQLADIYKLAGYPYEISQKNAPWTEAQGVLPAMLRMTNPLTTHNVEEINEKVIPHLEEAFKRDRTKKTSGSKSDMWDKNYRYTPKEWVAQLKEDMAKGKNSFAWTSIPDKVTEQLKALGYDGILDTGGKSGGQEHTVAIPFHPHQVRSKFAKFDPEHVGKADLMKHDGGSIVDHALDVLSKHRK